MSDPQTEHQDWLMARCGKLSSARMYDVCFRKKNGDFGAAREKQMFALIAEHLTGIPTENQFLSGPMLWGIETEPQARKAYELATGEEVRKTGFVDHPSIPQSGCSPDGLVGYEGLVEIKCPETRTHIAYMLAGEVPEDYLPQMHWQLACHPTREWSDFVSFDPRMPKGLQIFRKRLPRDARKIMAYENDAIAFLSEMSFMLARLESGHVESGDL